MLKLPKRDIIEEHERLIKMLELISKILLKEAEDQRKELQQYKRMK